MFSIPYDATRTSLFQPGSATNFFEFGPISSEAALCAEMARVAYVNDLNALREYVKRPNADFALLSAFGYGDPGSQAFIAKSRTRSLVVVAFRGTEADDPSDWFADARFTLTPWHTLGRVHSGFAGAWDSNKVGAEVANELKAHEDCRVLLTGHSLGAALATLAASVLTHPNAHLHTFGSPRVGDADFAASMQAIDHSRYVNCSDIVTRVPPDQLGYVHVGTLRYINRNGQMPNAISEADITLDRIEGAASYLLRYAFLKGTLFTREMADHTPINYVSAVMALRP
jgi:hypothetical protein